MKGRGFSALDIIKRMLALAVAVMLFAFPDGLQARKAAADSGSGISFTIYNYTNGTYADKTKEFRVHFVLLDPWEGSLSNVSYPYICYKRPASSSADYSEIPGIYRGDKIAFTLADGEYIQFSGIPAGYRYQMYIDAPDGEDLAGYTTSLEIPYKNNTGELKSISATGNPGEGVTFREFTNPEQETMHISGASQVPAKW